MATCSAPDCFREAKRSGLCWTHLKRRERGCPAAAPVAETMSPLERVLVAGNRWLEAETDEEHDAALRRFRNACTSWMQSNGWRPPLRQKHRAASRGEQLRLFAR